MAKKSNNPNEPVVQPVKKVKPNASKVRNEPKAGPSNGSVQKSHRQKKMSNFEKAKQVYEQLQEEKRLKREQEKAEREQRNESIAEYNKNKKKMNKAIRKTNRKGQPNLGSQMEVLLDKMQRKIDRNEL